MMSRLLACLMVCMMALLPASAQTSKQMRVEASEFDLESVRLDENRSRDFERSLGALDQMNLAEKGVSIAAALFRAIASQDNVSLNFSPAEEMHAYLRHPDFAPSSGSRFFQRAGTLYEDATSLHGSGYELDVDPMKMQCRLRINLGRLMSK